MSSPHSSSGRKATVYDALDAVRRWFASDYPGWSPRRLVVEHDGGEPISLPVPAAEDHADDFSSLRVGAKEYHFTPRARPAVRLLHEAMRAGRPEVPGHELLRACGKGKGDKVQDIFRDCEAWGTIIVRCGQSSYKLVLWEDDDTTSGD